MAGVNQDEHLIAAKYSALKKENSLNSKMTYTHLYCVIRKYYNLRRLIKKG